MKQILFAIMTIMTGAQAFAQDITLVEPSRVGGTTVMEALWNRHSDREYDSRELEPQDLSDLLFAASGINRPGEGKITSPTALNRQEIDLYLFTPDGVYRYDKATHSLQLKAGGDHRELVCGFQDFAKEAPVSCVLVADAEKLGITDDRAIILMANDAGIMSENIALFCAARGLATVPRATMDSDAICSLLGFDSKTHIPMLNLPVGYPKK